MDAESNVFIRDLPFYQEQRIGLHLNCPVTEIDRVGKRIWLENGLEVPYDRLLLATGSRAREFTGRVDAGALQYLRTLADARSLRSALMRSKRVAVIGGGFIGLEVAASAVSHGCSVTVFESANALLQRVMPPQISGYMQDLHLANGVDIRVGVVPYELCLNADRSVKVCTNAGDVEADLVVAGIGAVPNVELAQKAGIRVSNGIVVDEHCRTNDPSIYAAGDVTNHYNPLLGRSIRVESWYVAESQPVIAATNMLGGNEIYAEFPWLWSDQYHCNLQTLGTFTSDLQVVCRGQPKDDKFSVLGVDDSGRLRAACTVNNGRDMAALKRMALSQRAQSLNQLSDDAISLRALSA
jgi:anthranilate 1,2-dioxygenase ferredoxin reductase subunit